MGDPAGSRNSVEFGIPEKTGALSEIFGEAARIEHPQSFIRHPAFRHRPWSAGGHPTVFDLTW
jgi:hypothetical protein